MATSRGDYYGKTLEEVRTLPWEQQLDYYANNKSLYDQEISRVKSVLEQKPDHLQGFRWLDQLRSVRENSMSDYGKYDFTSPVDSVITTARPKYERQISDVLKQISNMAQQNQRPINVADDPRYQAQMKLMEGNVENNQQQTMEQMNAKGLLMSDMTNDRLGQIEQDAALQLNAFVPGLYDAISNERSREQQFQLQNLTTLFNAYASEDQRAFDNHMAMNQLSLQERQIAFNEGLQKRNYNLAVDAWIQDSDLAERQYALNEQNSAITNALNRVNTMGAVLDQQTAEILGVPVGTLSGAAKEAALNRQQQLRMHSQSLAAQGAAQKTASINQLIALWEVSGVAPPGLEQFGIKPGTELDKAPAQQLQDILAMGEISSIQQEKLMLDAIPEIQSEFGVDPTTAEAIYRIWENPTQESALADYENARGSLQEMGVDVTKVNEAIYTKFSPNEPIPQNTGFFQNLFGGMNSPSTGGIRTLEQGLFENNSGYPVGSEANWSRLISNQKKGVR